MKPTTDLEDRRIREFLAPLAAVSSVTRSGVGWPRRRRSRRVVLVAAAALAIGAGVGAGATILSQTQEASRSPLSQGGALACQGLEGIRADRAAAYFTARGLRISWRFTTYFKPGTHGGVDAYASAPPTVPPNSVVEDVAWLNSSTVIVSVRSPDDPYAPPLPSPACSSPSG